MLRDLTNCVNNVGVLQSQSVILDDESSTHKLRDVFLTFKRFLDTSS
jgi:hypothetical protein